MESSGGAPQASFGRGKLKAVRYCHQLLLRFVIPFYPKSRFGGSWPRSLQLERARLGNERVFGPILFRGRLHRWLDELASTARH